MVILTYDITNPTSFENLDFWYNEINSAIEDVVFILAGLKCDMGSTRKVKQKQGASWARAHKMKFYEVSSRTGENLSQLFGECVNLIL